MKTEIKKVAQRMAAELPEGIDEYRYIFEQFKGGDSNAIGKYYIGEEEVKPNLPFDEDGRIMDIAEEARDLLITDDVNVITITFRKDGTYTAKAEYDPNLDAKREASIREALGDELYEQCKREEEEVRRRLAEEAQQGEQEDAGQPPAEPPPLTLGDLLDVIMDGVRSALPEGWQQMIVEGRIEQDGEYRRIKADFYWQDREGRRHQFEPENPIGPMNALARMQAMMAQEGRDWREITLVIPYNGSVDIETRP